MLAQKELIVTRTDKQRLTKMIASLRKSRPMFGDPYNVYLRELEDQLVQTSVVGSSDVDDDVVTMNSEVCVRELETGRCRALTLVYDADADLFGEKVSAVTPLGAAILGSRVGDVVEWQTRRGPRRVQIERILFQPESAGALNL